MALKIGYLLNQYPKVSHSFIRSEILALEQKGVDVFRIAVRGWEAETVDEIDDLERERTHYVLRAGLGPLIRAAIVVAACRPGRFLQSLIGAWSLAHGGERGFLYHLIYLAEACLVLRLVARERIEHLHAHFGSNATTVALLVRSLGGPPYSFTVHGPEEFDKPLQWKLRAKIANAAHVIAISSFCRSQLFRWSDPKDWHKIHVVHCALDPRFRTIAPSAPPANKTLVCVGRLCEQKGQLLLVEVIAALHQRGLPVRLVLAGDGDMRGPIERAIAAAELTSHVDITGWIDADAVRQNLERACALVLPSFGEGLPVAIMEAMARGRPVLTTYIAGIPELVRDGVDGMLVPAGDAESLALGIESLLKMAPETLAMMGAAARSRVLERHDSLTEAQKLIDLIAAGRS